MGAVGNAADERRARTGRGRRIPHRDAARLGDSRGASGRPDGATHVGVRLTRRHLLGVRRDDVEVTLGAERERTQARAHGAVDDVRVSIDTRRLGAFSALPVMVRLVRGLGVGPLERVVRLVHDACADPEEEDGHQGKPPQGGVGEEGSGMHDSLNVRHSPSVPTVIRTWAAEE